MEQVEQSLSRLKQITATDLLRVSSLYRSKPLGVTEQPDFVNAVALLKTLLPAHELLSVLQQIEQDAGRVRDGARWGPRVLDLDILTFGDAVIDDDKRLTVPHPRIAERAFVLRPLAEIAPQLQVPGLPPLDLLLQQIDGKQQIERIHRPASKFQ